MYTTEQLRPHVMRTRRILGRTIASAGTAIAGPGDTGSSSNVSTSVPNHSNPTPRGGGSNSTGGNGSGGGSGGGSSFWGKFFDGLTFAEMCSIFIGALAVFGGVYGTMHDVQPNKHAETMAFTDLVKSSNNSSNAGSSGAGSSHQKTNCLRISNPVPGQSYLIPKGKCIDGIDSPEKIAIASASPLTSITGGDFIVYSGDESSSCDSRIGQDRCVEWMSHNQVIGNVDARHKIPRYWYIVQTFGKININSL